jgi:hypothetical protein
MAKDLLKVKKPGIFSPIISMIAGVFTFLMTFFGLFGRQIAMFFDGVDIFPTSMPHYLPESVNQEFGGFGNTLAILLIFIMVISLFLILVSFYDIFNRKNFARRITLGALTMFALIAVIVFVNQFPLTVSVTESVRVMVENEDGILVPVIQQINHPTNITFGETIVLSINNIISYVSGGLVPQVFNVPDYVPAESTGHLEFAGGAKSLPNAFSVYLISFFLPATACVTSWLNK